MLICISLACGEPVSASASINENAKPGDSTSVLGKIKNGIVLRLVSNEDDELALRKDRRKNIA